MAALPHAHARSSVWRRDVVDRGSALQEIEVLRCCRRPRAPGDDGGAVEVDLKQMAQTDERTQSYARVRRWERHGS